MRTSPILWSLLVSVVLACGQAPQPSNAVPKIKALIIDGENNHGAWPKTTMMMRDFLLETGLFTVDIERTAYTWQGPHNDASQTKEVRMQLLAQYPLVGKETTIVEEPKPDPDFDPDFGAYDVVISNLGWKASTWSAQTRQALVDYVSGGGGLVIVHAANNSFGDWEEYNRMIGVGGWGGRSQATGPYLYYTDEGRLVKDTSAGECGSHGPQMEYLVTIREPAHPITQGLPTTWLHTKDELYDRLRGPAEEVTVLATAYSDVEGNAPPWDPAVKGTGRHEPMLLTVNYGEGRVFHTIMGHTDYSMECVGFITTFVRGAEWSATGQVTQVEVPLDFPTKDATRARPWRK